MATNFCASIYVIIWSPHSSTQWYLRSQWKGEVQDGAPELTEDERLTLSQEMSDTLTFLVRLSQLCHVDLPTVVQEKFEHNAAKYPVEKVYGSSKKYTEYPADGASNE